MRFGIGVIGVGVMGGTHARTIHGQTVGAHVAAVYDADQKRAKAIAAEVGAAAVFTDPLQLIASEAVDAIVVASPDETHFEYVMTCLEGSKPVLCEKPLAATVEQCRRIVDAEARGSRPLIQLGFMRRFDPAYSAMKSGFDGGTIGSALLLRCIHRNARAPAFFQSQMSITNAMVHEFDVCRWLLGSEIRRISVVSGRRAAVSDFADPLLATLLMTSGQMVSIEVFMNARYGYDIRTELVGEMGVLAMTPPIQLTRRTESGESFGFARDWTARFADAYRVQMQSWINSLADGQQVGANAHDGLVATIVAEAAIKSHLEGGWIELPETI